MLPRGVQKNESVGPLRTFHSFSPPVSPSNDTCRVLACFVGVWAVWFLFCRVFVSCFASVMKFLKSSARIGPR